MIRFDAATVMLQWAAGGFAFLWVTTRGRLVGLGYGWLMRGVYAAIGLIGLVIASRTGWLVQRDVPAAAMVVAALVALAVSVIRKSAGVREQRLAQQRKHDRVAAMTNSDSDPATAAMEQRDQFGRKGADVELDFADTPEFPPVLDLIAPAFGFVGVVAAALSAASGPLLLLAVARFVVSALFLGAVSDAMLLGHWYLVQPGLSRNPIHELNDWLLRLWPVEVLLLLIPTGMVQALNGTVKDGWSGILSWFWCACALATGILAYVTRVALKERYYSAVMAATGFLYLAILMAFCTDLIARAILS
jgi:hypothetical protein